MLNHAEPLIMTGGAETELDAALLDGALLFLSFGLAPISELTRVLTDHLETARADLIRAGIDRLVTAGELSLAGNTVSLPAGAGTRETQGSQR